MNKRERQLVNLRWYCDLAIEGARLQRGRALQPNSPRHDHDFYLLCVWRLSELARRAESYGIEGASAVREGMCKRWPFLNEVRDWWIHAKDVAPTSWFSDGIWRLLPDNSALPVIDLEDDHADVERFYEDLCSALGPLPDLARPDERRE